MPKRVKTICVDAMQYFIFFEIYFSVAALLISYLFVKAVEQCVDPF